MSADKNYATLEVLTQTIHSITPHQQSLILRFAKTVPLSDSYPDHRDLFNEAILRCLDGRRLWPTAVDFIAFILEVMRSISYADRQNQSSQKRLPYSIEFMYDDSLAEQGIYAISAEECYERKKKINKMIRRLERLGNHCEDDPIAMHLIRGRAEGLRYDDLRRLHGISFIEHEAARKRISRRLKYIP
ncbi:MULTISPECIES: hypothetical protein [unclassified Herbaspirillum]|uniref:hypothetical protein n=1 Tax=unclassified Herbaspirillum TaxID=2624150 RepID=UPI0010729412|nr:MULTISPECIES: hypothetical protein [unclassified Herbaspirillum]TFI11246.1 hypothetical protein E4P32_07140 [Herbaspirillum sp. 3R11]TFI17155.1 hypothetical protein E4P31_07140 [Herbaspirillum sp. 3R-11]TFI28890.1 hypothetical protein E4P30_06760 [Herbaspirillum sp. 3C11]